MDEDNITPINRGKPQMFKIVDGQRVDLVDIDAMSQVERERYFALGEAQATITALRAALEQAREALGPFAAYVETISVGIDDAHPIIAGQLGPKRWANVVVGDCRRARTAHAALEAALERRDENAKPV
jgi:hypothetical protein